MRTSVRDLAGLALRSLPPCARDPDWRAAQTAAAMERELPVGLTISRDGQNRAMTEMYYAGRSIRDPDWRAAQIVRAREREPQRREDLATGRPREPEAASGLTFDELWLRVGGDRGSLWAVLRNEVRRGRIEYHSTTRRYVLNGGLDPALRQALLRVGRADDRR